MCTVRFEELKSEPQHELAALGTNLKKHKFHLKTQHMESIVDIFRVDVIFNLQVSEYI